VFGVIKTVMYPCEWYGGPIHRGQRSSNATCYYFRSEKEAYEYVEKMNELERKENE